MAPCPLEFPVLRRVVWSLVGRWFVALTLHFLMQVIWAWVSSHKFLMPWPTVIFYFDIFSNFFGEYWKTPFTFIALCKSFVCKVFIRSPHFRIFKDTNSWMTCSWVGMNDHYYEKINCHDEYRSGFIPLTKIQLKQVVRQRKTTSISSFKKNWLALFC